MKVKLVAVLDTKTEVFGPVSVVRTISEAERLFFDALSDSETLMGKHPEDFKLFVLGQFDQITGSIDPGLSLIATGGEKC